MTGPVLHVLIAPDCYGDSLTAVQAADAIATGWGSSRPDDVLISAPQSDGGPGFVGVLASRVGGLRTATVRGPLADDVTAEWVFDDASATAYVECAQACGLALLGGPPTVDTAIQAHSWSATRSMRAPSASSSASAAARVPTGAARWSTRSAVCPPPGPGS